MCRNQENNSSTRSKIKFFRTLQNMTQKSLGEKAGIGEATIRKYELGIRNPKLEQIKKIAQETFAKYKEISRI